MFYNFAEAERQKKEEAERKAKLDEIAEKQRQRERELEEKERKWREEVLGKTTAVSPRPVEIPSAANPSEPAPAPAAAAAAAAPSGGKYVPKFKRMQSDGASQAPPETDRWGGGNKIDDRPPSDRWRGEDRRPAYGGGASRSTWSSSRSRG